MNEIIVDKDLKLQLVSLNQEFANEAYEVVDRNRELLQAWLPWAKMTKSGDDELEYFRNSLKRFKQGQCMEMCILHRRKNWRREDKPWEFIGMCGLVNIIRDAETKQEPCAEIGYWLDQAHHGKGIITKCCLKLEEAAFTKLDISKLKIIAHKDNRPSVAVAHRLGFHLTEEKLLKPNPILHYNSEDRLIFSLKEEEWKSRRQ